jgi:hypothetical protein
MIKHSLINLNRFKQLIDNLEAHPDIIERVYVPIKCEDMLKLLELSGTMTRSDAIQFAISYAIDRHNGKILEELRYDS